MKFCNKILVLALLAGIGFSPVKAQTTPYAYIQIAHNCADSTLDTLDVFINGQLLDSNVTFHTATGMFTYPTDTSLSIGVAYKHSDGNPVFITTATFPAFGNGNQFHRYAFIISGVNGGSFAPNPDGISTSVSVQEIAGIDSAVTDTEFVDLRFFHGVTDMPAFKIQTLNGSAVYFDSLQYGQSSGTVTIRHTAYEFLVTSPDGSINYGTFYADLTGFSTQSVIVLSSGFLNPAANDSGPQLGLYVLEQNGALTTLPLETAGFQLLHNCADPAADSMDVYINGELAIKSLGFRNATEAVLFKAHATYDIGVALKNSASVNDTIWRQVFTFPRDTFFVATLSGVLTPASFAPNPQGISTAFQVLLKTPAEFEASSQSNFDFYMLNGVTDAPQLNLQASGGPVLLHDVAYAAQTSYISLPSEFYTMNVEDTAGNTLTSGFANFLAFPGQSAVLLTSGFYNPANNGNGPAMNLYMVPLTGGPFIPFFGPDAIYDLPGADVLQIYPNPVADEMHVIFNLPAMESVAAEVRDATGSLVCTLPLNKRLAGNQVVTVSTRNLAQGVYFLRLVTDDGVQSRRFIVSH